MGLPTKPTSSTFLSEKDFHATLSENLHKEEPITEDIKSLVSVSVLKIKLPPVGGGLEEEAADGCRTPTTLDHRKKKIASVVKCPPAPKKPKSLPSRKRRKEGVLLLDLSNEIESLFPSSLLKDFLNGKIKKLRKESCLS